MWAAVLHGGDLQHGGSRLLLRPGRRLLHRQLAAYRSLAQLPRLLQLGYSQLGGEGWAGQPVW